MQKKCKPVWSIRLAIKKPHRKFKTRQSNKFFDAIQPLCTNNIVGCESKFNWYWLADTRRERQITFALSHALYLNAIHGGKVKNDRLDSERLALLLKGGNFATAYAYAYPNELRATRDLLRLRFRLTRLNVELLTHLQIKPKRSSIGSKRNIETNPAKRKSALLQADRAEEQPTER